MLFFFPLVGPLLDMGFRSASSVKDLLFLDEDFLVDVLEDIRFCSPGLGDPDKGEEVAEEGELSPPEVSPTEIVEVVMCLSDLNMIGSGMSRASEAPESVTVLAVE